MLIKARIGQFISQAFMMSCLFWKLSHDPNDSGAISDIKGALYFNTVTVFMGGMLPVMLTFTQERAVFLKEHNSKMYGVTAYFFGRQTYELPFVIFFAGMMAAIIYFTIGYNSEEISKYFIYILIMIGVGLSGNASGLFVCSAFYDVRSVHAFFPLLIIPFMLFGGFAMNVGNMPDVVRWIQWLSPYRYAFESLTRNEFITSVFGSKPVEELNFELGLWQSILVLFMLGLGLRLIAMVTLKKLVRRLE